MDPVSCLYNFLSIGILGYFVIICFLIKKCCMNCGTNCAGEDGNLCKCYQKIYEGEITPSNHVIVREGNEMLPISYLLNQTQDNEGEYVLGEDGVLYRNEACKECCLGDDKSRSSCNSHEDVFILRATRGKGECSPCSPSALGLGEGSFKRTTSGRSVPTGLSTANSAYTQGVSINGSPQNISDISELKGVINYGGQPPTAKRISQSVDFHSELSEHVFTVEGSVGSSKGSQSQNLDSTSCGSHISNKSGVTAVSGGPLDQTKSATSKGSKLGSPGSKSGSACSSLGKPCPSSGSPSLAQSMKGGIEGTAASGYGLNADGSVAGSVAGSVHGGKSDGASMLGSSLHGTNADGTSIYGPSEHGSYAGGASAYGPNADGSIYSGRGGPQGGGIYGPDGQATDISGSTRRGFDGGLDEEFQGDDSKGMGKSGLPGRDADTGTVTKSSKSSSCVSPCGTIGSISAKKSKSSSFKLPCGSPGSPCPHKDKSSRSGSPASSRNAEYGKGGSPTSRKADYGKGGSPASSQNRNSCGGSAAGGRGSPYSKSDAASPYSTEPISLASSPSSPNQKSGAKCTSDICSAKSGIGHKNAEEKSPLPILKNTDDSPSPPREGAASPRVSIKDKFDIITPEGITSAPTFGKDECKPCPFADSEVSSGGGETVSYSSTRRNDVLSDEYKDNISNKRKADKISADYKDSADNSRGAKSARFSDHCNSGTCSSRGSSSKSCSKCSKGNKSLASSSTPTSTAVTSDFSSTKCSKCSKFSSDTRVSSVSSSSTKTKPSGSNSLCETTCKTKSAGNSTYLNSPNAKSDFPSVTTADIDDFRVISPGSSRCENLGSALARSSCGEIKKARELATCEAIKDPSKNVICNNVGSGPDSECTAIRKLKENSTCPSILEIIKTIDEMGETKNEATSASSVDGQMSRPGTSATVDAAVIHEISTKVQCCLQHARAIAAKVGASGSGGGAGGSGGGAGPSECRKTMRVQASSRGQAQSVKVNPNMTLNTKGITIKEYNKVDKPFGRNPGIQVKMKNADGNVEQFKKPYAELMTADGGTINIRIRSPCKSTPGKLLCVSSTNNPCCSDSTTASSGQPTTSSKGRTGNTVTYADTSEGDDAGQPSSQEYSSQDEPTTGAVVVYKRPSKQKSSKPNEKSTKGECSPDCVNCKKKTCPTSKYYKGRKKQGKLQVYNVTTSHFSQLDHFRSPYVKGMPVVDARMFEQYTHPERYRAGETYLKRRREMIQKIKGKCPWL